MSSRHVLIVEPSDIIRTGLSAMMEEEFAVQTLTDVADLQLRLQVLQPDVLLLNPTLLSAPARLTLSVLQQSRPQMAVAALVYQYVEPQLLQAFHWQLDIRAPRNQVLQMLRDCCAADTAEADEAGSYELTDRESEVLLLVAQGCSSKEIADQLNISIHTVNTHRKNITRKTGIKSVAGLAVYAMLHGMVNCEL